MPDGRAQKAGRSAAPEVRLTMGIMVTVFALFILIGTTAGLVFNTVTIALPKLVDERVGNTHLAGRGRRHRDRDLPVRRRRAVHHGSSFSKDIRRTWCSPSPG